MYSARQRGGKRWLPWLIVVVLIGLAGSYAYWAIRRPLPPLKPNLDTVNLQLATPAAKLAWPAAGQSAVGVAGGSILETHGQQKPVPTASTAKLITALVVFKQRPLKTGAPGPTITLTANDINIYNAYFVHDGSLVKVQAGEQISEYQMLQAMLLPSANNMADSLALWAFGSLPAYSKAANQYLKDQGLAETHVGSDASGFAPSTTSTAGDLVKIGELVMRNSVLAGIVGQPSAAGIPVAGNIKNVNSLLGVNNIIGVKTGNTDQAGGVFVSASRVVINQKPVTIVTALAGSPSLWQAMHDSLPLIQSAQANFGKITVVKSGQVIGSYKLPWGGSVSAVADKTLSLAAWNGATVTAKANLNSIAPNSSAGQTAGTITIPETKQKVELKLQSSPAKPTAWWRLTHPL